MKSLFASFVILVATFVGASPVEKRQTYTGCFPPITELAYCANPFNLGACLAAHGHASLASQAARDYFPNTLHNGRGDALRHCYWNARMVIDPSVGVTRATTIATNHENGSDNPEDEKAMDLQNNAIGRGIGVSRGNYDLAFDDCYAMALNGTLSLINTDEDSGN